ncbi:DOMON-like domain-containing protein [Acinetobacter bohemicus]|uniref:DOMON-like domain-containing protein n=1 Tax=Acinetobacter lwoffii TaxID=28090 RepID=A0A9D2UTF3_ACILW|nr:MULTISPECIES: DOMON-like domain-containing protein [Acinetobacter]MDM1781033.1 DOMON-like domain-containing protein [Acinetobacter indicus]HJF28273.1 DOMON-like domain-containing protein [Acinetobacter lwoffii]MCO8041834.1 DOMON-like domain-containing protein [Acinetobacter sp. S4400-12]MCU7223945.1 DOMON-like domain-containing protein [Acinetobacter bohemicus]QKQ70590.1 DOMON-like domain-containing protein [Acinetobacter sp. 10FS3-1]
MASYELSAFDRRFQAISLVGAIEPQNPCSLNVGFWLSDPNQYVLWPDLVAAHPRQDFLWEQTCFEIFIGVRDEDFYREINLSPSQAWQAYQFEEYRYPEDMPPQAANDIELNQLKRTHYGLNVSLDLTDFMSSHELKWSDLFIGLSAVLSTTQGTQFYAMQHSSPQADFHNKRDWLHVF